MSYHLPNIKNTQGLTTVNSDLVVSGNTTFNANVIFTGNTNLQILTATTAYFSTLYSTTAYIASLSATTERIITTSGNSLLQNSIEVVSEYVTDTNIISFLLDELNWTGGSYAGSTTGVTEGQVYIGIDYTYLYKDGNFIRTKVYKRPEIVYLTYYGTSGTTSGTKGVTKGADGIWSATTFDTVYYLDDKYGNMTVYIPDANSSNVGKTMTFVKPRLVQSSNRITIRTISGQYVNQMTGQTLNSSNDRMQIVSVPFSSDGSLTYKYRSTFLSLSIHECIEVSLQGNQLFSDIKSAVDFCNSYSDGPKIIKLNPGTYNVPNTVSINCAYPISIEGFGTDICVLSAATTLSGTPMFDLITRCDFSKISFYGLNGKSSVDNECCLNNNVSGLYGEIHQCYFNGFYKAVESIGSEFWCFDSIIENCVNGLWMSGGTIQTSEMTISDCTYGVNIELTSTNDAISIQNILFNVNTGQTGITYNDNGLKPNYHYATGNAFYSAGTYINGFTWNTAAQTDIRYENNVGLRNYAPLAYLEIKAGVTGTTLTTQGVYYRLSGNTTFGSNFNTKFTLGTTAPRATYLPAVTRMMHIVVTGSIEVDSNTQTLKVALYKNGTTNLTEVEVRCSTSAQSEVFALNKILDVNTNDYFELFCANTTSANKIATLSNLSMSIKT